MMEYSIDVIITTYNGSKYLPAQIDSILNQTYSNFKVIVINDCSEDNTFNILEFYKSKLGEKFTIINNTENIGLVKSIEKGIQASNSDIIFLADQDDYWNENKMSEFVKLFGQKKAWLLYSNFEVVDEGLNKILDKKANIKQLNKFTHLKLLNGNAVPGSTLAFKKELKSYILPFPEGLYIHDWWIVVNAYMFGSIYKSNKKLLKYRQHTNNSIGAFTKKYSKESLKKDFLHRINFYENTLMTIKLKRNFNYFKYFLLYSYFTHKVRHYKNKLNILSSQSFVLQRNPGDYFFIFDILKEFILWRRIKGGVFNEK